MGTTANSGTLPRVEVEAWIHDFVHEIRNHLNAISLETTNLIDLAASPEDGMRLQMRIQMCGAYLKVIRDGIAPEPPHFVATSTREILEELLTRGLGNRLVWPPDKQEVLDEPLGLDKNQVVLALEMLIRDALELAAPGEAMVLSWNEGFRHQAIGLQLSFSPVGEYVPVEVSRWGKVFEAKVGGILRRYQIARLLELNGGLAAWTYLKHGARRMILAHVEFSSVAQVV